MEINRCFKPSKFDKVIDCSLNHFSDADQDRYGQVSNLRLVDQKGMIHYGLVMTESRVTPIKFVSIPRLELAAAALSIKISMMLRKELTIHSKIKEYFWTDSQVVLSYINSNSKRFNLFVANRVQLIKENSDVSQWMYIESKFNPADYTSRGLSGSNQEKVKHWVRGPEFLWKDESSWVNQEDKETLKLNEHDPEVKGTVTANINKVDDEEIVPQILNRFSSWCRMLRVMAWVLQWIKMPRQSVNKGNDSFERKVSIDSLSVEEFKEVELKIIQVYQKIYFENEIKILKGITNHKMLERIGSLNPFIDSYGILRVGGRLKKSILDKSVTHPIILPKSGKVTEQLIRWCCQKTAHSGRNITLSQIRSSGYWVMQGSSAVKKMISRCVTCRRLRGRVG